MYGVVSSSGQVVDLVDPARIGPAFWFQQMDAPRAERNRFHIDVDVSHDVAEERIAAALAAGGRMVSDQYAKAWWVLADPEGNEACICTWQNRDRFLGASTREQVARLRLPSPSPPLRFGASPSS